MATSTRERKQISQSSRYDSRVLRSAVVAVFLAGACGPAPSSTRHMQPSALGALEAARDLDGAVVGPADGATVVVVFASWCSHCRDELPVLAELRVRRPDIRIVGLNYRGHEEYDGRGDAAAVRAFVAELAPWLRVVPADEALWTALGRPPKVPTLYVFAAGGALVRTFDRRNQAAPSYDELAAAIPSP